MNRVASAGEVLVVLNCGSSSIKFAVFDAAADPLPRKPVWNGKVQGIGGAKPDFGETGVVPFAIELDGTHPYRSALALIRERILARLDGRKIVAIAHRVVHGGSKYFKPTRIDAAVLADLKSFIPLAPLHQPFALEAIEILLREQPQLPQVACFDTGFHLTLPKVEQLLPLPHAFWERGLRRYGFHGLSYDYMATALPERHGDLARGRVIVAHLGSGASLCALRDRRSVDSSLGFTALDGLCMGTRPGTLDPGIVLYLFQGLGMSAKDVETVLYRRSGLLGISGISSDMRDLLASDAASARLAIDYFVYRATREIGALTAVLGGLDAIVFTAGIGEHSAVIRRRICEASAWLGLQLDLAANDAHATCISAATSKVSAWMIPTNEELMIARHTGRLLGLVGAGPPLALG